MTMQERNEQMENVYEVYRECQQIAYDFFKYRTQLEQLFGQILTQYGRLDALAIKEGATQEDKNKLVDYTKNSFYPAKDAYVSVGDKATDIHKAVEGITACIRMCGETNLDGDIKLVERHMRESKDLNNLLQTTISKISALR